MGNWMISIGLRRRIWVEESMVHGIKESPRIVDINSYEFNSYVATKEDDYEPDYCGVMWKFEVEEILDNRSRYQNLIEFIEDDEFPLKKEYNLMRQYSESLFARLEKPKNSDDWFANF